MNQKPEYDFSISFIRVISMFMIIACHFFAYLNNRMLAELFRIGVFLFFYISGYLYGNRKIDNYSKWIKNRILRIFIPLYIYFIIYYLVGNKIVLSNILFQLLNLQGLNAIFTFLPKIPGPWFFTAIMLCYLLTILVKRFFNGKAKEKPILFIILLIIICVCISAIRIDISGIVTYFIGYIHAKYSNKIKSYASIIPSLVIAFSSLLLRYVSNLFMDDTFLYNNCIVTICSILLTFSLFNIVKYFVSKISFIETLTKSSLFQMLDSISIYVYLTHEHFINESIIKSDNAFGIFISYLIVAFLSIVLSYVLNFIGSLIERSIKKRI